MTRRRTRPQRRTTRPKGLSAPSPPGVGRAVAASIGLTAVGVASAARRQPAPTEAERQVQREIDAMIDSGHARGRPQGRDARGPDGRAAPQRPGRPAQGTRRRPGQRGGRRQGGREGGRPGPGPGRADWGRVGGVSRRRRPGHDRRRPHRAGVAERDRRVRAGTPGPDGRGGCGCDLPQRSPARRIDPLCRRGPRRRRPHRRLRRRRQGRPGPNRQVPGGVAPGGTASGPRPPATSG